MLAQEVKLCTQENEICRDIREAFEGYNIKRYGEDERLIEGTDVTIELREKIDLYLNDIERITKREILDKQRDLIKDYINNNRIYRVNIEEHDKKRKQFHHMCRKLRKQWEIENEKEWPKYEEDVYVNGKVWRLEGQYYDAHHIIEVSFGGPNVWYNLFPAASPDEHPYGIHDDYSICTEIFGPIDRRYRKKKRSFKNLVLSVKIEDKKNDKDDKGEKREEPKVTRLSENVIRIG